VSGQTESSGLALRMDISSSENRCRRVEGY
jgi:hypothetical protein